MPKFELDRLVSYDDDALVAELRRVAALIDSQFITQGAFDQHSKASSSAIRRRFGGWRQALLRAGLAHRFGGGIGARGRKVCKFSDEEVVAEMREIWEKLGRKPMTAAHFNQHAKMNSATVTRHFGSCWAAMKKADLPMSRLGKRYSDDNYFENLLAVWTHYGRQPKYREMDAPPSCISSGAYEKKWETWTKALLAFLDQVNRDARERCSNGASTDVVEERKPAHLSRRKSGAGRAKAEHQRQITLGLRYDILKRDRFRCVLCGASPATNLGCVLHVDHMVPYSKGGQTICENLRTLCESCNIGKSAKVEENSTR